MKKILLMLAMCAACGAQVDPFRNKEEPPALPVTKEFRVSQANSSPEKKKLFMELWEEFTRPRLTPASVRKTFWIKQTAGEAGGMHRYICSDDTAVLLEDGKLLEDAMVRVWVNPAGVYDFGTVGGFTRRVPLFKEALPVANPDAPTRGEFVAALKAGESFTVVTMDEKGCPRCFGDGLLGALDKNAQCPDCGGTGETVVTWVMKW